MKSRVMHLRKSGAGMAARTACGRSVTRTPIAGDWETFKKSSNKCGKCSASELAAFLASKEEA